MRDFSCFGDSSVSLATATAAAAAAGALDRSLLAATESVYKAAMSSRKELLIKVTWTRSTAGAGGLAVGIDEGSSKSPSANGAPRCSNGTVMPASTHHFLQKKRGSRSFVTEAGTVVGVYWDTTEAKYPAPSAAEPSRDYYLAVVADAELALLIGGAAHARRFAGAPPPAPRRALLARREQLRAAAHTTRCRFHDDGQEHEVSVLCRGDEWEPREGEVSVSIDGKKVVEARRVKWNFRGNRTVVLGDGAAVEVMWDVHDWWFGGGGAQFMLKARGEGEGSRLWLDEELARRGRPPAGFFLHVQCYKR